jgi:hypothetical protein
MEPSDHSTAVARDTLILSADTPKVSVAWSVMRDMSSGGISVPNCPLVEVGTSTAVGVEVLFEPLDSSPTLPPTDVPVSED